MVLSMAQITGTTGERLRAVRIQRGLSQSELAKRAGLAQSAISQFERGLDTPRLQTLSRLAVSLGISAVLLIPDSEPMNSEAAGAAS